MLSALELVGFKSFADKTRFEFPNGISVIVGPNGSGKSNIVDGVKWVLGAQSVKALRGKEMADVIFSGTGNRTAVNTAEVTLTFDNSSRLLGIDSQEVLITRRVYRSGEGEYFINRNPCRLRDIRNLLAGTGIATDAYSIIEQGKVDVMLQSSPRDRRVLFEEAAGISRFKAKKLETERRLSRVEQNLLRLTDIVEEVDARLRRIRAQASKARRYEEYSQRLKELRLSAAGRELTSLRKRVIHCQHQSREFAARQQALSERLEKLLENASGREEDLRECENVLEIVRADAATNHERIVRLQAGIEQHLLREHELDRELTSHRRQYVRTQFDAIQVEVELRQFEAAHNASQRACQDVTDRLVQARRHVERVQQCVQANIAALKAVRTQREAAAQRTISLERQISVLSSQRASARAAEEKCRLELEELLRQKDSVGRELERDLGLERELAEQVQQFGRQLEETHLAAAEYRRSLSELQSDLGELKLQRTAATQRASVLKELQQRLEGVGAGTKHLLLESRRERRHELRSIRGLVSNLLRVDIELAPLVELVLGQRANLLVLDSQSATRNLAAILHDSLPGRAGLIGLDSNVPELAEGPSLDSESGVVARLDRLVQSQPEHATLVRQLLGNTWLVDDLATAIRLADRYDSVGLVTRNGEYISPDGMLLLGPKDAEAGMLTRQSELIALGSQIDSLKVREQDVARQIEALRTSLAQQDSKAESLSPEHAKRTGLLSEQRLRTSAAKNLLQQTESLYAAKRGELEAAARQASGTEEELARSKVVHQDAATALASLELELRQAEEALDTERAKQVDAEQRLANVRVELANAEQECKSLTRHLQTSLRRSEEAQALIATLGNQLQELLHRREETRRASLTGGSELALAYVIQERWELKVEVHAAQHQSLRTELKELRLQRDALQNDLRAAEHSLQERELTARQLAHEKSLLITRYQEEYEIDLESWLGEQDSVASTSAPNDEQEIADLRRKINNLGAVNLEAVSELNDLQQRHESLDGQLRDLTAAKNSLEQIISRINVDSRKMFLATIDVVRQHFKDLFRRLFGGGQADLILEGDESEDVLERGIEIVARPPGKEPRSISLLSGGEKTLTCVALLLAVFRSRPSPFCILDEVDAALDEANIERFASVLREFLHATQFIVVTHSKRTMSFADTLYGITMQESGVSKPVSVRFDDRTGEWEDAASAKQSSAASTAVRQDTDETQAA